MIHCKTCVANRFDVLYHKSMAKGLPVFMVYPWRVRIFLKYWRVT